ncbi:MAG: tetratricopeptide repeat-containing sensor histidine kinase [Cyclobacteriaceae bacterium]
MKAAGDAQKVGILFHLSKAYQYSVPDTAVQYARASLELAEKLGDEKGIGDALISLGQLKREQGNYTEALQDLTASLEVYETIQDSIQIANALNDISIVYAMSGDDEKALEYFEETLALFRAIDDAKGVSHMLNNMGVIHRSAGDLVKAKEYFIQSIQIKEARKDTLSLPRSYANMGSLFNDLGADNQAWHYYRKADSLFRFIRDKQGLASNLNAMAQLSQDQGKLSRAKKFAAEGLQIAQETNTLTNIQKTSQQLAKISEQLEDFSAAYRYLQMYTAAKDSLFKENQANHLEDLKAQFDSEQQASKIAMLEKDQQLQQARLQRQKDIEHALLSGIIILLILLFIFINMYRVNRRQKKLLTVQNQEIHRQKEALREINETKDRFFSILSHDLKGPLNTLKGFVFLLSQQAEAMTRQEVKEMSDRIGDSLQNLQQLLDNLLTWSLSQIQQQRLDPEALSLYELTEEIFRLYEPAATEKQIRLKNSIKGDVMALADRNSVNTVLRNLVANSIKFSYPEMTITVGSHVEDEQVLIRVTDQGMGMDQATVAHLFSLDKKTSGIGTANEKGSGFGLVLCEELVRKNGGQLWVASEEGKGSTFTFTLPFVKSNAVRNEYEPVAR